MNMDKDIVHADTGDILAVVPARANDLARLDVLSRRNAKPTVTVIGKYNHGKSRLLNELMGVEVFSVADRRETVALSAHETRDVRWLDAPGLDADVDQVDDSHAQQAIWLHADIRLFVHAATAGELDAAERTLLQSLGEDDVRTQRQTLFVLTQIDQLPDDQQQAHIVDTIRTQGSVRHIYPVSATRHRMGVEGGKQLLLEKSGFPHLQMSLREAQAKVPSARAHEAALLFGEMHAELTGIKNAAYAHHQMLQLAHREQRHAFEQGLNAVLDKVAVDLQPVVDHTGIDHAMVPDSFENAFKLTAGKKERARLQVAYSRACIAIQGHLVAHGVVGLPPSQQTSVRSLDTVMVAVMGVSVKYRDDLKKLFMERAGRDRLLHEFCHYFELSPDRQDLERRIDEARDACVAVTKALAVLHTLEQV